MTADILTNIHNKLTTFSKGQRRIVPVESLTLELPGPEELQYRALWQEFFRTVSIRERTNPRCQNSFLPMRSRGVMSEFLPLDDGGAMPSRPEQPRLRP